MTDKQENKPKVTKEKLLNSLTIFKYVLPYTSYFVIGMLLLVVGTLIFLLIPEICGELLNVATNSTEKKSGLINILSLGAGSPANGLSINQLGIALIVILILQGIISFFRVVTFAVVSEKGMADVRKDLYKKMITQDVTFFENNRVGEITSRITTDVELLQSAISITLAEFLRQIIILLGGVVILAYIAPRLSLIMLLTFPVVIFMAMAFGRYIKKLSKKRQKKIAEANTVVEESMTNFKIVKSFTNEKFESNRYSKAINKVVDVSLKYARARGLFFGFVITLLFGCILYILWRGAVEVQLGNMESGNLVKFIFYTMMIGGAIAGLGNLYASLAGALGASERVKEILESDTELELTETASSSSERLSGDIVISDVAFSYPARKDVQVLKDINISIPEGSKIALVGQSGSGKSTIVSLLMHFYDLESGSISIGNSNINDIDLQKLRSNIGIVPQEVLMFGGTIRENISYGRHSATEDDIQRAAKDSNCLEFIEQFPNGLDTIVGERGIKLSGGQKQRIAIARAILKDPSILVLDEATSSLDAESEKLVQQALDKLMENRTSIIIAHRLATIKNVDQIYVIENGKIKEQGKHDVLMENENGLYRHLASLQFALN